MPEIAGNEIDPQLHETLWKLFEQDKADDWVKRIQEFLLTRFEQEDEVLDDRLHEEDPHNQMRAFEYYHLGPFNWLVHEVACADYCASVLHCRTNEAYYSALKDLLTYGSLVFTFRDLCILCERPVRVLEEHVIAEYPDGKIVKEQDIRSDISQPTIQLVSGLCPIVPQLPHYRSFSYKTGTDFLGVTVKLQNKDEVRDDGYLFAGDLVEWSTDASQNSYLVFHPVAYDDLRDLMTRLLDASPTRFLSFSTAFKFAEGEVFAEQITLAEFFDRHDRRMLHWNGMYFIQPGSEKPFGIEGYTVTH